MRTRSRKFWKDESELAASPPTAAFTPSATTTFAPCSSSTTATVSLARNHRAGFIHNHRTAHEIAAVASFNGVVRGGVIVDFDESEAAGFSSESVAHHVYAVHIHPSLRKEIGYIGLRRRIREVPDE
jgi:hypothetical protein